MASPTKGLRPLDPDGVPPLSLALRGGNPLYQSREPVGLAYRLSADARLGTDKMGSGAYWPQRGPGAEPHKREHKEI